MKINVMGTLIIGITMLLSCSGKKITTAEDWVALCQSATSVEDVDKAFVKMSPDDILLIYEQLIFQIGHDDINSPLMTSKCKAVAYIQAGIYVHVASDSKRFSDGQRIKFSDLTNNEWKKILPHIVTFLGDEYYEIYRNFTKLHKVNMPHV